MSIYKIWQAFLFFFFFCKLFLNAQNNADGNKNIQIFIHLRKTAIEWVTH